MTGGVVVTVVGVLVMAAVVVVVLRGRLRADVQLPGMGVGLEAGREPEVPPVGPTAVIRDAESTGGGIVAAGSGGAEIERAKAAGDIWASTEPGSDPKA